jgi:UDP-2,4-diacetamido-2,4,6-trideoxy-beta-L-altropyranose hydrolase
MSDKLFIRTDAGVNIGIGHLMRCIALAQAWKEQGGEVTFIGKYDSDIVKRRLLNEGFKITCLSECYPLPSDIISTLKEISGKKGWVVLDGYHFSTSYQKSIRYSGFKLLVIDDLNHLPYYDADIILNQNLGAETLEYKCNEGARVLKGNKYVLLRQEFNKYNHFKRPIGQTARNILVTIGGSDNLDVTSKIIRALEKCDKNDVIAKIVIGPANPQKDALIARCSLSKVFEPVLNPENMAELMEWADIAITGGGTTVWECIFMQLPTLVIIVADNQKEEVKKLELLGAVRSLGLASELKEMDISSSVSLLLQDFLVRKNLVEKSKILGVENGTRKVIDEMVRCSLFVRHLEPKDCETIWLWANDEETRKQSFSGEFIPWNSHKKWFEELIGDPNKYHYIAFNQEGVAVGYVRFYLNESEALCSLTIAPEFRGKRLGSIILAESIRMLFKEETKVEKVIGYIKSTNIASLKVFQKVGFKAIDETMIKGQKSTFVVLEKGRR